jgi:Tfp pilus assembly protein PilN
MIKINLLQSVTEQPSAVARVEDKVAHPRIQTLLMAVTVFGLLMLGAGYDYVSSRSEHEAARVELENQRRINQQMLAVTKEQADLERKSQDIQKRIDAIKQLRASQQGPNFVLREIKERFDNVPGLYLKSIEQHDGELTIKGESPNEYSVTRFGQSLEFSSGMFTDLHIETERQVKQEAGSTQTSANTTNDPNDAKPEVISFLVKCTFSKDKSQLQNSPTATSQVAMKK